jgi:hypothetical protein
MTPYSRQLGKDQFVTGSSGQTNHFRPIGYYDYVTCPISNKGDFFIPTPWSFTIHQEDYMSGSQKKFQVIPTEAFIAATEGNLGAPIPVPAWDARDSMYNLALNRLNDKVRGSLDLSVALAEAGTTTRMIKNTIKLLRHARKLKPPGGFGSTRDVANGYLQYKYGWKPLLSDIFGVADESIRIVQNKIQRISAGSKVRENGPITQVYSSINGTPNVRVMRIRKETSFSGCRIGVILQIPPSAFRLDRWMSMNPISIGWELIPYSFVVDWVYDIGSYLRNVETALLYNTVFYSGYVSEIQRVELEDFVANHDEVVSGIRHMIPEAKGKLKHIVFSRRRLSAYPFPRKPTFNVDLSSSQLFSAAALLRQLLPAGKRGPRPEPPNYGSPNQAPRAGLGR